MNETYTIISDEEKLKEFIEWLPDLEVNEKYYCCLFGRKKYCKDVPWIKSDKGQLKRFVSDKDKLYSKIAQLECKLGAFQYDGNPWPQEALALYISINPRDLWKATLRSFSQLAKIVEGQSKTANPHQEVLSEIQRTKSKNVKFISFDLDSTDEDLLWKKLEIVDGQASVIKTRGGFHIHVLKDWASKTPSKTWYNEMAEGCDVTGDMMSPVVGSYQGGHVPVFIHHPS
jgi:hypothetical protein